MLTRRFSSTDPSLPAASAPGSLLSAGEAALLAAETTAAMAAGILALSQTRTPLQAGLQTALEGAGPSALSLTVAADDPATAEACLADRLRLLALRAQVAGHAIPEVIIPVEHPEAQSVALAAARQDATRIAADFGRRHLRIALEAVMDACDRGRMQGFDPAHHPALARAVQAARRAGVPEAAIAAALAAAEEGHESFTLFEVDGDEAVVPFPRVALSMPDLFLESALTRHGFAQSGVRHADAERMLEDIAAAIWSSGRPRLVFRDRALPVSLAAGAAVVRGTVNVLPFLAGKNIDVDGFCAAVRIVSLSLAEEGADAAAIGLTNIAAGLMARGLAYDSAPARACVAALCAAATAEAALVLSELAARRGTAGLGDGRQGFFLRLQDTRNHLAGGAFDVAGFGTAAIDIRHIPADVRASVAARLDAAAESVRRHGMLCWPLTHVGGGIAMAHARTPDLMPETTLLEQDMPGDEDAAVYRRRLTSAVPAALARLGYTPQQIDDIHFYVTGHGSLLGAPGIDHDALRHLGFDDAALARVERAFGSATDVRHAINPWTLGRAFCRDVLELDDGSDDDILDVLGFDEDSIAAANLYACGRGSLDGAPHLRPEHMAVFDTAVGHGIRRVTAEAQLLMQAAAETGLTGGVVQTLTLDPHTGQDAVRELILTAWEMGVQTLALYRAGCGLDAPTAPLATSDNFNQDIDIEDKIEKKALLTTR